MTRYFERASSTSVLLGGLAVSAGFLFVVFPALPIGGPMLDAMPGYTHAEAVVTMDGYGENGRRVYIWGSLILDTLFPFVYVTLLAGALYRWTDERLRWLAWLPIGAGAIDLGENAQVIAMLAMFPDVSQAQVAAASVFTQTKSAVYMTALALAVLAALVAAVRRVTTRSQRPI